MKERKTHEDRSHQDDPENDQFHVADDLDCEGRSEHSPDAKGLGDQGPVVIFVVSQSVEGRKRKEGEWSERVG